MASEDWVPGESERKWLPAVDVREVVGTLPPGSVNLDDPAWKVLPGSASTPRISAYVRGLADPDPDVAEESLTALRRMVCGEGTTSIEGVLVVPSLIRAPAHVGPRLRAEMLQLAGDMARVDIRRQEVRSGLLRTMQPLPVYDPNGYQENWSVEAVRAMVGRDGDLLAALLEDDNPTVRGRAAYVLAAAKPIDFDLTGVMHARLAVEPDPAVQMILVLCIAQIEKDRDRTPQALSWARDLWSDRAASLGLRLGGVVAWLGLTPEDPLPELRTLRATMPMSRVGAMLRQLPWIRSLVYRREVDDWWRTLDLPDDSGL